MDPSSVPDSGQLTGCTTGPFPHTLDYDARLRLQRRTAGTGLDLTYSYDRTSQVLGITDTRPGQDQQFDYDALGRLTSGGPVGDRQLDVRRGGESVQ